MGFDTNFPTQGVNRAHPDHPPHWHMFMSPAQKPWNKDQPHIYNTPDGLIERNVVRTGLELKRGETDHTVFLDGAPLFTETIATDGSFLIGTAIATCQLTPVKTGFDSGVDVSCNSHHSRRRIYAEDDAKHGKLRVFVEGTVRETYTYDVDTYLLLNSNIDARQPWE